MKIDFEVELKCAGGTIDMRRRAMDFLVIPVPGDRIYFGAEFHVERRTTILDRKTGRLESFYVFATCQQMADMEPDAIREHLEESGFEYADFYPD